MSLVEEMHDMNSDGYDRLRESMKEVTGHSEQTEQIRFIQACKVCGAELKLIKSKHYISRDGQLTGLVTIVRNDEAKVYDTFDCEVCGCQNVMQERKMALPFGYYFEDYDNEEEEIKDEAD